MAARRKYTTELLVEAVAESTSVAGVLRFPGVSQAGGSHAHMSRSIKVLGLDTSHFRRGLPLGRHHARLAPEQILVAPSSTTTVDSTDLAKRSTEVGGGPHRWQLLQQPA